MRQEVKGELKLFFLIPLFFGLCLFAAQMLVLLLRGKL